jgi:hypothetical protein
MIYQFLYIYSGIFAWLQLGSANRSCAHIVGVHPA